MTTVPGALYAAIVIAAFLLGIRFMNSPKTAAAGNLIGSLAMLTAIVTTLVANGLLSRSTLLLSMGCGGLVGYGLSVRAAVIRMPQFVALLNGLGGGASFLTALALFGEGSLEAGTDTFAAGLAILVGGVTFSGSMVAAAKLDGRINQRPVVVHGHAVLMIVLCLIVVFSLVSLSSGRSALTMAIVLLAASLVSGVLVAIRIGGADMPVAISLLNSLSGVAASIAGITVRNPMLVAVGAIVGAAGLILTRIMCRSMNRSLFAVMTGHLSPSKKRNDREEPSQEPLSGVKEDMTTTTSPVVNAARLIDGEALKTAEKVVIVPGYGMALAQAQFEVKALYTALMERGKEVVFAIHPVAGRMPGHMNVLLAEVDIPYDRLAEMETVNPAFPTVDVVVIVGANDVVNPSASTTTGTPLSGMPVLRVTEARHIIVCNLDDKPGYAGVENPLYTMDKVSLLTGDAKKTVAGLTAALQS